MTKTDNDDHLTDHEWRLKMAAEGKAFYMPGRLDEDVRTVAVDHGDKLTFELSADKETLEKWAQLAESAHTNLWEIASAVEVLASAVNEGSVAPDDYRLGALMNIVSLGLRHMEERDGRVFSALGMALTRAKPKDAEKEKGEGHDDA